MYSIFYKLFLKEEYEYIQYKFQSLCYNGRLEEIKQYYVNNTIIDIYANKTWVFRSACMNGHLKVAKWLLETSKRKTNNLFFSITTPKTNNNNIFAKIESTFVSVCENGYLKVVKWLLKVKPDIDISVNNDRAFRYSCYNEHFNVAKLLMKKKPDIKIPASIDYICDTSVWFHRHNQRINLKIRKWFLNLNYKTYSIFAKMKKYNKKQQLAKLI